MLISAYTNINLYTIIYLESANYIIIKGWFIMEKNSYTKEEIEALKYPGSNKKKEYTEDELLKLRKKSENGDKLTDDEANALHKQDSEKAIKDIDQILQGVNDIFSKDYVFSEDNEKFHVEIKAPNVIEDAKIKALREKWLDGTGLDQNMFDYTAYTALATLNVCGTKVPVQLSDNDKIYPPTLSWLYEIGVDFNNWMSRFRS